MQSRRMRREAATVEHMIRKYCKNQHHSKLTLCDECRKLLDYANKRLRNCPFQDNKTTCGKCAIHCYKPTMRKKIQTVMRTVGPQMIFSNPLMAIMHILDGLRKKPTSNT